MRRWIPACLIGLAMCWASFPSAVAHQASRPCVGDLPISAWFTHGTPYQVVRDCVTIAGIATGISLGETLVTFSLTPNPAYVHFLVPGDTAYGSRMVVTLASHRRVQGHLVDGAHVAVTGPLVLDDFLHATGIDSAERARVLPAIPPSMTLTVRVVVFPRVMVYKTNAGILYYTSVGATCSAAVVYDTGAHATSLVTKPARVGIGGIFSRGWHADTPAPWGTAGVYCTKGTQHASGSAKFTIFHR